MIKKKKKLFRAALQSMCQKLVGFLQPRWYRSRCNYFPNFPTYPLTFSTDAPLSLVTLKNPMLRGSMRDSETLWQAHLTELWQLFSRVWLSFAHEEPNKPKTGLFFFFLLESIYHAARRNILCFRRKTAFIRFIFDLVWHMGKKKQKLNHPFQTDTNFQREVF